MRTPEWPWAVRGRYFRSMIWSPIGKNKKTTNQDGHHWIKSLLLWSPCPSCVSREAVVLEKRINLSSHYSCFTLNRERAAFRDTSWCTSSQKGTFNLRVLQNWVNICVMEIQTKLKVTSEALCDIKTYRTVRGDSTDWILSCQILTSKWSQF